MNKTWFLLFKTPVFKVPMIREEETEAQRYFLTFPKSQAAGTKARSDSFLNKWKSITIHRRPSQCWKSCQA